MGWMSEIEHAIKRSGGKRDLRFWMQEMKAGRIHFAAGKHMHGSVWFGPEGAEIAHLYGEWDDKDAEYLHSCMIKECERRGVDFVAINGRPGWRRFLRMKGFEHGLWG